LELGRTDLLRNLLKDPGSLQNAKLTIALLPHRRTFADTPCARAGNLSR
jgi:hypothetical protein